MREPGTAARAMGLVVAAGLVIGLAGCGGKLGPGPARPRAAARHHEPVTAAKPVADPALRARAQALGLALSMLARQAIPAGARRLPASRRLPWALQLAENINDPGHTIRLHRAYLVPSPESLVIGFLRDHFPARSTDNSYEAGGTDPELAITYRLTAIPDGVFDTFFFAGVLADGPNLTWLRLDAMVDWGLPRTPAEHIDAARYQAVVVAGFAAVSGKTRTRTFTAPAVIASLARLLNATHSAGDASDYYCPLFTGGDQLTFEPKPGRAPEVTVQEGPCFFLAVTVGGRAQPTLTSNYRLERLVGKLTGVR